MQTAFLLRIVFYVLFALIIECYIMVSLIKKSRRYLSSQLQNDPTEISVTAVSSVE